MYVVITIHKCKCLKEFKEEHVFHQTVECVLLSIYLYNSVFTPCVLQDVLNHGRSDSPTEGHIDLI